MTLATSEKYIQIPVDNGRFVAIPYVAPKTSEPYVNFPDGNGGFIAQKYVVPTSRFIYLPTADGYSVALGLSYTTPMVWEQFGSTDLPWRAHYCIGTFSNGDLIVCQGQSSGGGNVGDIYVSTDEGISWTKSTYTLPAQNYNNLVILSDDTAVLMQQDGNVYISTDKGSSFHLATTTGIMPYGARSRFGSCVLSDDKILVMGGDIFGTFMHDVWKSTNGGSSWQLVVSSAEWSRRWQFWPLAFTNDDVLFAAGPGSTINNYDAWISNNDGASWTEGSSDIGVDKNYNTPICSVLTEGNYYSFNYFLGVTSTFGTYWANNNVVSNNGIDWASFGSFASSSTMVNGFRATPLIGGGFILVYGTQIWKYS